ncbi:MAG TPA: MAPEG family protein [Casimicrobiaceae bacterium]
MNPAPMPYVTALYAGILMLLLVVLAFPISRLRGKLRTGLGDGGHPELARAIRAHANLSEWGVPVLLLLLVAELNRAPVVFLHVAGITLVIARLLHAFGLSRTGGASFGRMYGTGLTWLVLIVLAVWNIWAFARLALR